MGLAADGAGSLGLVGIWSGATGLGRLSGRAGRLVELRGMGAFPFFLSFSFSPWGCLLQLGGSSSYASALVTASTHRLVLADDPEIVVVVGEGEEEEEESAAAAAAGMQSQQKVGLRCTCSRRGGTGRTGIVITIEKGGRAEEGTLGRGKKGFNPVDNLVATCLGGMGH